MASSIENAISSKTEVELLQEQVSSLTEQLLALRAIQQPTDGNSISAIIDAIIRLAEHPLAAAAVGSLVVFVGVPFLRAYISKNFNGFGKSKDGEQITFADIQKTQLRLMKENRFLLTQIARKMGVKKNDL